jgi:putative DNA primase/helicase
VSDTGPIGRVISRLRNVKTSGDSGRQWTALCPSHPDHKNSLGIGLADDGKMLLRCYAGCSFSDIVKAMGLAEKECFPAGGGHDDFVMPGGECGASANGEAARDETPAEKPVGPLTLEQLAADKMLPLEFLRGRPFWMRQLDDAVGVCYYPRQAGDRPVIKRRTALKASEGSYWPRDTPLLCYGIWLLDRARELGYLVLVEGESDVWRLYYHGYPVLGIPGANAAGALAREHLEGVKKLYAVREPDDGGNNFVRGLAKRLGELGRQGEAYVIDLAPAKDPNDVHRANPTHEAFKAAFDPALAAARPLAEVVKELPPPAPAGAKGGKKKSRPVAGAVAAAVKAAAGTKPPYRPGTYGTTDLGNAERLVARHGQDILYCHPGKSWFWWDGAHWKPDDAGVVMTLAKETVRSIYAEANDAEEKETRESLAQHAVRSEAVERLRAMVALAQSEPGVPVLPDEFDRDPFLLNVANGVIDLKTGILREHRREDMMMKITDVVYDTGHACPQWEKCVDRWMGGNRNLVRYLQLLVGHSLTGDVSEQSLYFFHGLGSNGKTTFLSTVLSLLGDYATPAAPGLLVAKRHAAHPTEQADLFGRRLVTTTETEKGEALAEALVKLLTGSDKMKARFMYQNFFEFDPTHKIILSANHKPVIRGVDLGVWRRIKLIPWTQTIPEAEKDKHLVDKLKDELSGILNWAVRGCLGWLRDGMWEPEEVKVATAAYQAEQDTVAGFVAERCVKHPEARAPASKTFKEYGEWSGDKVTTVQDFKKRMEALGFVAKRLETGVFWLGLKLDLDSPDNLYER